MTKTATPVEILARIHPPNKQRGYHARTILLTGSGYPKFSYKTGWYVVDEKTAQRMRKLLNNPNDPHSRPVFQVCTREEADALDVAEIEVVATAKEPIPMPQKVKAKVTAPDRTKVRAKAAKAPADADLDLRDDMTEEEWAEEPDEAPRTRGGYLETADADDLAEMEALASGEPTEVEEAAPKSAPKRSAKKKKAKAKGKGGKKPTKKARRK